MTMRALLYTPPTGEPVSLESLKLHLRIELDVTDEDEYLEGLIVSAREEVEHITRRAIMTQTWDYYLEDWPNRNHIVLPFGNLQSVPLTQYIEYTDSDGDSTTLTPTTEYLWETNGEGFGRIVLPYAGTWPSGSLYPSNPITIRFVCGWTTAALVPFQIKAAIKMICAELYEGRGEAQLGMTVHENKTYERLLASYKLWGNF